MVQGSPRTRVCCFGYHQRRHPPRPLLTQPRPFYAHGMYRITLKPPHRASHRADEVENVVLVACLPKQAILLACISPHSLRLGRVVPVLPVRPAGAFETLGSARAGAESAVHATPPASLQVGGMAGHRACAWLHIGKLRARGRDGLASRGHEVHRSFLPRRRAARGDRAEPSSPN
jgi:hypothetical protein